MQLEAKPNVACPTLLQARDAATLWIWGPELGILLSSGGLSEVHPGLPLLGPLEQGGPTNSELCRGNLMPTNAITVSCRLALTPTTHATL